MSLTLGTEPPFLLFSTSAGLRVVRIVTLVISGRTLLDFEVLTRLSWIHVVGEIPPIIYDAHMLFVAHIPFHDEIWLTLLLSGIEQMIGCQTCICMRSSP